MIRIVLADGSALCFPLQMYGPNGLMSFQIHQGELYGYVTTAIGVQESGPIGSIELPDIDAPERPPRARPCAWRPSWIQARPSWPGFCG